MNPITWMFIVATAVGILLILLGKLFAAAGIIILIVEALAGLVLWANNDHEDPGPRL